MDVKQLADVATLDSKGIESIVTALKGNGKSNNFEKYEKQLNPLTHDVMNTTLRMDKFVKVDNTNDPTAVQTDSGSLRIERVARVSLAIQKLIVNRAVSFLFGNDPTVTADVEDDTEDGNVLKSIKKVLFYAKTKTLNRQVAKSTCSYTEGAELWYITEDSNDLYGFHSNFKLKVALLSPANGDVLYPMIDTTGDMIAFSRSYVVGYGDVREEFFETFTNAIHVLFVKDINGWRIVEGYPKRNAIGKIPVVYAHQDKTEWQDVQGLIDRLEKLLSNFADTNDYHASPKIFTTGSIVGWAKKGESGAIIEGEEGATAQYLSWAQAPESVRLEIETMLRMIYTITQTPDISFDSVKSIGAISGVALKLLFMDAHLKVLDKMGIFDSYLQRRISIVKSFLKLMNASNIQFTESCARIGINCEINPFMIDDEKSTVDMLLSATGQKAICSRRTAIERLGFVPDIDKEIEAIEDEESSQVMADITEPTM